MGYLNNIINDARGLTVVPAAVPTTTPPTESSALSSDGPAAGYRMPNLDSAQSDIAAPADEQSPSLAVPDGRHGHTVSQSTTTASLSRDADKRPAPEKPLRPPTPDVPLHSTRYDPLVTEGAEEMAQVGQQSVPVDGLRQEMAAGRGLTQAPDFSLPANVMRSYLKQPVLANMGQSRGREVPASDGYDVTASSPAKSPEPTANIEKTAVQTAELMSLQEPAAVARDETAAPSQSGQEAVQSPPESTQIITPEGRDATQPVVTTPQIEPRVHIGQIDIVVMAPEPVVAPPANAGPGNSDFSSRHYLREL